jgi:predicted ArsR family transcriptional regulator
MSGQHGRMVADYDLFTYPTLPGFKARETSRSAAADMAPRGPRLRQLCLDALRLYGPLTADECADHLHIDKLSIRPRFSELAACNRIVETDQRRQNASGKSAVVWRLA